MYLDFDVRWGLAHWWSPHITSLESVLDWVFPSQPPYPTSGESGLYVLLSAYKVYIKDPLLLTEGARCSSVVTAFAHVPMGRHGRPIELFLVPASAPHGMCYTVCGMVHIKEPLLLIRKSSLAHVVTSAVFLSLF